MKCLVRLVAFLFCATPLFGCTFSNLFTIHRSTNLDQGSSQIIDAKQRLISNIRASDNRGYNRAGRIICAEPSPDVAAALSQAMAVAAEADVPSRGSGSLQGSRSAAESLAQLGERLATIQLLRDGLYRACEAYANGAITDTIYAMIVSGIDDTMVTLLASEMAAGAFGRDLASIAGFAGAGAVQEVDAARVNQLSDTLTELEGKIGAENQRLKDESESGAADSDTLKNIRAEIARLESERSEVVRQLRIAQLGAPLSSASGMPLNYGGLSNVIENGPEQVAMIHQASVNRNRMDSVIVACIAAMDRPSGDASHGPMTPFGNYCRYELLPAIVRAYAQERNNRHQQAMQLTRACESLGTAASVTECLKGLIEARNEPRTTMPGSDTLTEEK